MRLLRWSIGGLFFGLMFLVSGPVGDASISGTNGCQASGTWQQAGLTVDAATATGVITIPRKDTVNWQGSVDAPPGKYSGSVWVELPPPFGKVTIDSWSGDSQTTTNSGSKSYDLPSLVPAGVEFTVAGEHIDTNGTCNGSVSVQIDGSALSSPVTWASLGGTALTGAGLAALLRSMFRRVV